MTQLALLRVLRRLFVISGYHMLKLCVKFAPLAANQILSVFRRTQRDSQFILGRVRVKFVVPREPAMSQGQRNMYFPGPGNVKSANRGLFQSPSPPLSTGKR
ncbi:hypothetical protein AVEN_115132-1 [Araneus ventricosus]|uniref:Uncharacterized protein n=1 Tax=Araneus ventricosus TaxID=182803 RepID=A0A4Y1ZXD7_ARAVE|nr:hypothetical protein AVEN_115132-1 [Araneus ventricosus]